jgi:hypothetical protein
MRSKSSRKRMWSSSCRTRLCSGTRLRTMPFRVPRRQSAGASHSAADSAVAPTRRTRTHTADTLIRPAPVAEGCGRVTAHPEGARERTESLQRGPEVPVWETAEALPDDPPARSSRTVRSEAPREAGRFKARDGVSPQAYLNSTLRTHPERNAEDAGLPQAAAEGV